MDSYNSYSFFPRTVIDLNTLSQKEEDCQTLIKSPPKTNKKNNNLKEKLDLDLCVLFYSTVCSSNHRPNHIKKKKEKEEEMGRFSYIHLYVCLFVYLSVGFVLARPFNLHLTNLNTTFLE